MKENFLAWLGEHRQQLLIYVLPVAAFLAGVAIPSPFCRCGGATAADSQQGDTLLADSMYVDTVNMVMPDSSVYDGSIRKGTMIREKYGRLTMADGNVYEGDWKDDVLRYGTRTGRFSVYRGSFDDSLHNEGFGIIEYKDSFIISKRNSGQDDSHIIKSYAGNWRHNNKNGIGRAIMADGTMQFGRYRDGVLQPVDGAKYRAGGNVYGIDISHHISYLNWDNLALYCDEHGNVIWEDKGFMQPVLFVYMKATEGANYQDNTYALRNEEATRHGIRKGAYHFFRPGTSVDEQVRNFIGIVSFAPGDLPPALDIENEDEIQKYGQQRFTEDVLQWLDDVEAIMHVRPVIYTRENIRDTYMNDPRFKKYGFWISRYNAGGPDNKDWTFWQKSEKGHINGCDEKLDIDVYKGSYNDFLKFLDNR